MSEPDPTQKRPSAVNPLEQPGGASPARVVPSREQLERVRAREPEALGEFFDLYLPFVYGLLHRLTADRAIAEDLSQDVFLKVHRALDRLDPTRDPQPWLTTIAYNACRDHWRASSLRRSYEAHSLDDDRESESQPGGFDDSPLHSLLQQEREQLVQRAIAQLPLPQREIVVLHLYQGLSHDQIAELIGISHAAVRKRYSRALMHLGATLREWVS